MRGLDNTEGAKDESDGDELDPAIHASDLALVMEVMMDLNDDDVGDEGELGGCYQLTDEELNLGRFALSKVSLLHLGHFFVFTQQIAQKPCQTSFQ
jgi:hypothetical protein